MIVLIYLESVSLFHLTSRAILPALLLAFCVPCGFVRFISGSFANKAGTTARFALLCCVMKGDRRDPFTVQWQCAVSLAIAHSDQPL